MQGVSSVSAEPSTTTTTSLSGLRPLQDYIAPRPSSIFASPPRPYAQSPAERLLHEARLIFDQINVGGDLAPQPAPVDQKEGHTRNEPPSTGDASLTTKAEAQENDDARRADATIDAGESAVPVKKKKKRRKPNDKPKKEPKTRQDFFSGSYVCGGHLREECSTCSLRVPVQIKYGLEYAADWTMTMGAICLHRSPATDEPCGLRFATQRSLMRHLLEHDENDEALRTGKPKLDETTKQRRLEVSSAVITRMLSEDKYQSKQPEEDTIAALVTEERTRLGYSEECEPCAEVVTQRYRWEKMKPALSRKSVYNTEKGKELVSIYFSMVDQVMREDKSFKHLSQERLLARIAHQYDTHRPLRQQYGKLWNKKAVVTRLLTWIIGAYSDTSQRVYPEHLTAKAERAKRLAHGTGDEYELPKPNTKRQRRAQQLDVQTKGSGNAERAGATSEAYE